MHYLSKNGNISIQINDIYVLNNTLMADYSYRCNSVTYHSTPVPLIELFSRLNKDFTPVS